MSKRDETYEGLIEQFTNWAQNEENLRAAIVIGSRARSDHPADAWSDLDLIVLANDPAPYWQSKEWLQTIGTPWLSFVSPTPDGRSMEHRVLFSGGLDVDFALSPAGGFRQMLETGIPPDVADTIYRGIRFLVDKDQFAALLPDPPVKPPAPHPPPEGEFLNLVHNFWYHTLWTAKHLRRGELWWAKAGCDMHLKQLLNQMLEWHARATRGQQTDTWLRGRFLEEWADPEAVTALAGVFAHYDETDIWRALLATMDLFARLESETASALEYAYPSSGELQTADLVYQLFTEREGE